MAGRRRERHHGRGWLQPQLCLFYHPLQRYNNSGTAKEHKEQYVANAEGGWHVYACEWTADYIAYYIDGNKYFTYTPDNKTKTYWPFNTPFYIILNLAWGGSWGGQKGVDESVLPATMKVDYVRVFQK